MTKLPTFVRDVGGFPSINTNSFEEWGPVMELDLKDYLQVLRKRWMLITAIVVAASLAAGIVSYVFLTPIYQASTKIIVNKSNDQQGLSQINSDSINMNIRLIETYKEIIKTPAIMNLVAEQHPEFQLTTGELISKIHVSSVNNTQVMTLSVQDPDYKRAAEIVNAVSTVFKEQIPGIMKVDNVSILNQAEINKQPAPVKPNKNLNIAIAFVLSLMVAVGIVFLLEYLDDTVKSEEEAERLLGLPILASVTKLKDEDANPQSRKAEQQGKMGVSEHVSVNQ